ncbi:UNVERIFIED_CONTAM: hypothetical protein K2H54_054948 [Gekko kuhli]
MYRAPEFVNEVQPFTPDPESGAQGTGLSTERQQSSFRTTAQCGKAKDHEKPRQKALEGREEIVERRVRPKGQQLPVSRRDDQPCCFHHALDEQKEGKAAQQAWTGKRLFLRSLPNFSNFPSHPSQAPPVCPPLRKSRRRIARDCCSGPEPPAGCKTRRRRMAWPALCQ